MELPYNECKVTSAYYNQHSATARLDNDAEFKEYIKVNYLLSGFYLKVYIISVLLNLLNKDKNRPGGLVLKLQLY